ncbi:hypothetical protein BGZ72_000794, partial [Mortierella alpina]
MTCFRKCHTTLAPHTSASIIACKTNCRVRETLQFSCDLRFPSTTSQQEKRQIVDDLILELGLKSCADVLIGDAYASESGTGGTRGISGGERRRVSAAIQLLTRPNLLICDEVTSGLDAFTSFELVKTLEKYARVDDKTVVLSIHQPRSEIFHLLSSSGSQLVLLAEGDVVYSGPLDQALSWFESIGMESCSKHMNPFDHILDLSMVDYSTAASEQTSRARIAMLVKAWSSRESTKTAGDVVQSLEIESAGPCGDSKSDIVEEATQATEAPGPGVWSQTCTLSNRAWKSQIRNHQMLWGNSLFCVFLSFALGAIFWRTDGNSFESIRARTSVCIILVLVQPFVSLTVDVIEYARDIKVCERERRDGWNEPRPYLLSHLICAIPRNIVHSVVHVSIVFFIVGLRTDASSSTCFFVVTLTYTAMHLHTPSHLLVMVSSVFSDLTLVLGLSGNSFLEGILEIPVHYYPGPILQLVGHFMVYFLLTWLLLTCINPNGTKRMLDISPAERLFRFQTKFFITWEASDRAKASRGKDAKADEER